MSDLDVVPWNRGNTNSILRKDEVGRAKPSTYKLPGGEFSYGKPNIFEAETCKEVTMTWMNHIPTPDIRPDRDFTKLNKMAIKNKLYRNEVLYQVIHFTDFRKYNDARVTILKGKLGLEIQLPPDDHYYGQTKKDTNEGVKFGERPRTPVKDVIFGAYANEALQEQKAKYQRITSAMDNTRYQSKKKIKETKHTKASMMCQSAIKEKIDDRSKEPKTPFKLSKYQNVQGKTETKTWIQNTKAQARPQSAPSQKTMGRDRKPDPEENVSEQYRVPSVQ